MTKPASTHICLKIILCFAIYFLICPALSAKAKQELRGKIYMLGENDIRIPVTNTTVRIKSTDDSNITSSTGMFRIYLPDIFRPGETVTLEVEKPKYRILHPFAGEVRIPANLLKDLVEIILDKEGSHRFMNDAAFAKLIENTANKSKQQIKADDKRKAVDLSSDIKEWAVKLGLGIEDVQAGLDKWAADIEARRENFHELALAAFYKQKFKDAAQMAYQSAMQYEKQLAGLPEHEKRINEKKHKLKEKIIRDYRLAGDAHYNDYRFEDALVAYQKAMVLVNKANSPKKWASLMNDISTTYWNFGVRADGSASRLYLKNAANGYREISKVYTRESLPLYWAGAQNNMGLVLQEQGIRTEGEEGTRLLCDAVKAFEAALMVCTREILPQQWAMTQNNMGNALSQQGDRTGGKESVRLFSRAVKAYKAALTVRTRESSPHDWAMTQNNMGIVLKEQGNRVGGNEGLRLLREAVEAYRAALTIRTHENLPQDWAMTQNNMGIALSEQGTRTRGKEGARLLDGAIKSYKAASTVYTRESSSQDWAMTQNNMGLALRSKGILTGGEEGTILLSKAVEAFNAALTVYTRENLPQDWAMTQNNLAITLQNQGTRTEADEGLRLLEKAINTYNTALTVRTRESLPQYWADTQNNLGTALKEQALRVEDGQKKDLFQKAVKAFKNALEVRTYKYLPLQWAKTYKNMAETYYLMEDWANAATCYSKVLKVYRKDYTAYERASYLYHERLFQFDKAYGLSFYWIVKLENVNTSSLSQFIETHFTTARFEKAEEILEEVLPKWNSNDPFYIPLCIIEIANLVALKKNDAVSDNIDELVSVIKQQPADFTIGWSFNGVKHFIKNSEKLKPDSKRLLSFFAAVEGPDRDTIIKRLQNVQKK
ncbi:MAG: tetratricopeptide repeat protein [Pseudomonadota bacterium]